MPVLLDLWITQCYLGNATDHTTAVKSCTTLLLYIQSGHQSKCKMQHFNISPSSARCFCIVSDLFCQFSKTNNESSLKEWTQASIKWLRLFPCSQCPFRCFHFTFPCPTNWKQFSCFIFPLGEVMDWSLCGAVGGHYGNKACSLLLTAESDPHGKYFCCWAIGKLQSLSPLVQLPNCDELLPVTAILLSSCRLVCSAH